MVVYTSVWNTTLSRMFCLDLKILWSSGKNEQNWSQLHNLAMKYLCIQATYVPCERLFSKTGSNITEKRNRLKPKNVNSLSFLSSLPNTFLWILLFFSLAFLSLFHIWLFHSLTLYISFYGLKPFHFSLFRYVLTFPYERLFLLNYSFWSINYSSFNRSKRE